MGKKCAKSGPDDFQEGDIRSAILEIMLMDKDVESVSQAIVSKFMRRWEMVC